VTGKVLIRWLLLEPALFLVVLFFLRAVFFTALELGWPGRAVSYHIVLRDDLIACIARVWIIFPIVSCVSRSVMGHHPWLTEVAAILLLLRVTIFPLRVVKLLFAYHSGDLLTLDTDK
jgi:hypothetical protein